MEKQAQNIDARGLLCPEPIRLAELAMQDLASGTMLKVFATDPAAPLDFEAWCLRRKHVFIACEAIDDGWDIRIRKGPTPGQEA